MVLTTGWKVMAMMTVREVAKLAGVSVRTLHHYDQIGLLPPAARSDSGYRLYDDDSLRRLQQILLLRELEFSLADIQVIVCAPGFDWRHALEQQVRLLELKREHIDNLIDLATNVMLGKADHMDFTAFDKDKLDSYAAEAKAAWGQTAEYREFEQKFASQPASSQQKEAEQMMSIFAELGSVREQGDGPASPAAQQLVARLQNHISENFYTCTDEILDSLGEMYAQGGDFTSNIDNMGGEGTAVFTRDAIRAYLSAR